MTNNAHTAENRSDCLIIGGGPAGLTAAIYLARFHLSVCVIDIGDSRAARIPLTHNHAGFPEGISGKDLMERMARQAAHYGVVVTTGSVLRLARTEPGFSAQTDEAMFHARAVLLATGVRNHQPTMMSERSHDRALAAGRLRYCPICDGYEVTDRRVAVLGTGARGCKEAIFLRSYTADLTLVAPGGSHDLTVQQRADLVAAGVTIAGSCRAIKLEGESIMLDIDGQAHAFDSVYPALGSDSRSELAAQVGADLAEDGCLLVDTHQRTSVSGLYAAGDVVIGLDQISHAMGEGAVAATTMRNDLAAQSPLLRQATT